MAMEFAPRPMSMSSSSSRKRKHYEDLQLDPRYNGYVQYTGDPMAPPQHLHSHHHRKHKHSRVSETTEESKERRKRRQVFEIVQEQYRNSRSGSSAEQSLDELSDTGADVGEDSIVDDTSEQIKESFNSLNYALSHLLAYVDKNPDTAYPVLERAIGRDRALFVNAMKAMDVEGTLPWLVRTKSKAPSVRSASGQSQTQRQMSVEPRDTISIPKRHERERTREPSLQPSSRHSSSSSTRPSVLSALPSKYTANPTIQAPRSATASVWPPPLPKIQNADLERQVFTHKSCVNYNVEVKNEEKLHNERLEWIGDSYLGVVVSRMVFGQFPHLREGPLSEIRVQFVGNEALHRYALAYGFEKRLRADKAVAAEVFTNQKVIADLMEAYIGGLLLDSPRGAEIVDNWLRDLFQPKLVEIAKQYEQIAPLNKAAKGRLTGLLGGKHTEFDYCWVGGGGGNAGGFDIEVSFTGWGYEKKILAKGWGANKNDATIRACQNALANEKLIQQILKAKDKYYAERGIAHVKARPASSDSGTASRVVLG